MISKWTAHLKPGDKESFESTVRNSSTALYRLTDIIKENIAALECPTKGDYEDAAWAYKQADRVGQLRAYKDLLKLTDLNPPS